MDLPTLFRTLLTFQRDWVKAAVDVTPRPWGAVIRNDRFSRVYMANMALAERLPSGGPSEILADMDDVFRDSSVRFRSILFEDAQAAFDGQEEFIASGFRPTAEVAMARLGLPSCFVNPDVDVREAAEGTRREDFRQITRAIHDEAAYGPEVHSQLWSLDEERKALVGEKDYVAYLGDEPAGTFSVWPRRPYAVVESVATHPRFRKLGVGRTMIFDACNRAISAGCEWILLVADLFDTPKMMYKTLGFEPIGELRGFFRDGV